MTNTAAAHQPGHLEELPGSRGHPAGPGHSASQVNSASPVNSASRDAVAEFERLYRGNVDAVTAFFARRTADPQVVADLTADTFVAVITSIATFDPRKGTARAWVFGIARRVYATHCEAASQQQRKLIRLAGRRDLSPDHVGELLDRIDAQRSGRRLVLELTALPEADRAAIELVDLAGLRPGEAASVLGVSPGALRMRLMRARARLRTAAGATTHQTLKGNDHD